MIPVLRASFRRIGGESKLPEGSRLGEPQVLEGLEWPMSLRGREDSEPRLRALSVLRVWKGWSEDQNLGGSGTISGRTVTESEPAASALGSGREEGRSVEGQGYRLRPGKVPAK